MVREIAVYIDALERESIEKAIKMTPKIETTINIVSSIAGKFIDNVGEILANNISKILENVVSKSRLKDKYILVVIDDVSRAIGLDKIEWYVKWLYELRWRMEEEYKPKSINFIATTSEGRSLDIISRHRHAHILLLWNLNKKAFKELFLQLNSPEEIEFEEVWRLLGGNPGKLIELATVFNWNINMLKTWYRLRLEKIIREVAKRELLDKFREIVENIIKIDTIHDISAQKLADILVEENLIIYKKWITLTRKEIPQDIEIGIGEYYAWQTPLYREVLRELMTKT